MCTSYFVITSPSESRNTDRIQEGGRILVVRPPPLSSLPSINTHPIPVSASFYPSLPCFSHLCPYLHWLTDAGASSEAVTAYHSRYASNHVEWWVLFCKHHKPHLADRILVWQPRSPIGIGPKSGTDLDNCCLSYSYSQPQLHSNASSHPQWRFPSVKTSSYSLLPDIPAHKYLSQQPYTRYNKQTMVVAGKWSRQKEQGGLSSWPSWWQASLEGHKLAESA